MPFHVVLDSLGQWLSSRNVSTGNGTTVGATRCTPENTSSTAIIRTWARTLRNRFSRYAATNASTGITTTMKRYSMKSPPTTHT